MHEGLENLYNYTDGIVSGSSYNLSEDSTIINIIHLVSSIDQGGIERLLLSMAPYWNLKRFNIVDRFKRERIEWRVIWRLAKLANMHRVSIFHSHTPYLLDYWLVFQSEKKLLISIIAILRLQNIRQSPCVLYVLSCL